MKKKTLNLFLLSGILVIAASCNNNSISTDKVKAALESYNQCSRQCDEKERSCIADHDACLAAADAERTRAGVTCSHVPPANRIECIGQAIDKLIASRKACDDNFKRCLGEVAACRKACADALRVALAPDTR
jgi:hypothetical protein